MGSSVFDKCLKNGVSMAAKHGACFWISPSQLSRLVNSFGCCAHPVNFAPSQLLRLVNSFVYCVRLVNLAPSQLSRQVNSRVCCARLVNFTPRQFCA